MDPVSDYLWPAGEKTWWMLDDYGFIQPFGQLMINVDEPLIGHPGIAIEWMEKRFRCKCWYETSNGKWNKRWHETIRVDFPEGGFAWYTSVIR